METHKEKELESGILPEKQLMIFESKNGNLFEIADIVERAFEEYSDSHGS